MVHITGRGSHTHNQSDNNKYIPQRQETRNPKLRNR